MNWQQVFLKTHKQHAEILSDELMALGSVSVTFLDSGDQPIFEPSPGAMPLWDEVTLVALFEQDFDLQQILEFCEGCEKITEHKSSLLEDQAWERVWMDEFHPMHFGGDLWIVPSWAEPPKPEAVNLMLDPGLAFGTGTHPTTSMCLEYLAEHPPKGRVVVDFGCGSGVLAIAALKLGAERAYAIDNDPQALLATRDNAEKNGIDMERLIVLPHDQLPEVKADLVMANILAQPLISLAQSIQQLGKNEIVLSGILDDQAQSVCEAYTSVTFQQPTIKNDWCLLIGHISC